MTHVSYPAPPALAAGGAAFSRGERCVIEQKASEPGHQYSVRSLYKRLLSVHVKVLERPPTFRVCEIITGIAINLPKLITEHAAKKAQVAKIILYKSKKIIHGFL